MTRDTLTRLALPLLALTLLAACGQKGALYLPDSGAAPVAATPPADGAAGADADHSTQPRKHIH